MTYLRIPLEDVTALLDPSGIFQTYLTILIQAARSRGHVSFGRLFGRYDPFSDTLTIARKETMNHIQATESYRWN